MTCRHRKGDPNCSSTPGGYPEQERQAARERDSRRSADAKVAAAAAEARVAELLSRTPNPDDYEIVKHEPVGPHMVLLVQYSSCEKCSFDSRKIMVFLDVAATDVMYWRRIDPHFSESDPADRRTAPARRSAPAPRARYPADDQGWDDAVGFARSKAALPVGWC